MVPNVQVYYYALLVLLRGAGKYALRYAGETLKRCGRKLAALGEESEKRWTIELFHRCHTADAEFYLGTKVLRGPMQAAFVQGDALVFRLNWLATRDVVAGDWQFEHGSGKLELKGFGAPHRLDTGDVWFTFDGGHALLHVGKERARLAFPDQQLIRTYTYR